MDTYILQVRMKPYVFLQYVSVPSSNVILLYVVVHYESGKRHNAYHSKVQQSPVVENFLAKEPTKFFEVYLNATDDGLPPSDVTLDIVYMSYLDLLSFRELSVYLGLLYSTKSYTSNGKYESFYTE